MRINESLSKTWHWETFRSSCEFSNYDSMKLCNLFAVESGIRIVRIHRNRGVKTLRTKSGKKKRCIWNLAVKNVGVQLQESVTRAQRPRFLSFCIPRERARFQNMITAAHVYLYTIEPRLALDFDLLVVYPDIRLIYLSFFLFFARHIEWERIGVTAPCCFPRPHGKITWKLIGRKNNRLTRIQKFRMRSSDD